MRTPRFCPIAYAWPSRLARVATLVALLAPAIAFAQPSSNSAQPAVSAYAAEVDRVLAATIGDYQWFHANPELSEKEFETSKKLAAELRAIGLEVHEGIGGTGIVGILRGKKSKSGPVVLYRADMDALPVTEKTGLPYASRNPGVMHACGHDVHMATALGSLRVLKALQSRWSGTVLFVGQPAEELGSGARAMLEDPKFQQLVRKIGKPKVAFALHDASDLPAGKVALRPGYASANVDEVDIVIYGKGSHGARPEDSVDPIVIGAEIVMSLQTIVSRRVPPEEPAVVTVGSFHAGTKHNIIPPEAKLQLTVRSYSDHIRKLLLTEIERIATNIAAAHNAPKPPTVTVDPNFVPSGYNDPAWAERLETLFRTHLGADNVERHSAGMGGEDFGLFGRELQIPAMMWRLGAVDPELFRKTNGVGIPGTHSDGWAPAAEPTLRTGIITVTAALLEALGSR